MKLRDYIGRRVVLQRQIGTRVGYRFEAGAVLVVESHWRGCLSLATLDDPPRRVTGVRPQHVVVVGPDGDERQA